MEEIRARLRAGEVSTAGHSSLRFAALVAGGMAIGFVALWFSLRVHPLPPSASIPTWDDVQAAIAAGMPSPSHRPDPAVQSGPPAISSYQGKSAAEVGKLADQVCFQRAQQRYPHWSKTPRLLNKSFDDFTLDSMDHYNEVLRCLLTEGLARYCSARERRMVSAEIATYFRGIAYGNHDLERWRQQLQSGKIDPRFAEVQERLGEPIGSVDPDYLQKAMKDELVYDLSVLDAIEARLRDGLLTKAERDHFTPAAPQWIRDRFARVEPPKSDCPDQPWWAFWR
jgi:hypothetical protein